MFRIGLPIGVTLVMEVGLFAAAGFVIGLIGTAQLAAHQIALQCASVTFMVPLGLAQAATVRVGLAAGADDGQGVLRSGLMALIMGAAFMLAMATLMWTAPAAIVGLFVDAKDPANAAVVHAAVTFLAIAALFQIFDGGQVIGAGALRGLKDTRWPMAFAAFAYWAVGGTLALVLGFGAGLGGLGVWLGLAASLAVAAALMIGRFLALQHRGRLMHASNSGDNRALAAWRRPAWRQRSRSVSGAGRPDLARADPTKRSNLSAEQATHRPATPARLVLAFLAEPSRP